MFIQFTNSETQAFEKVQNGCETACFPFHGSTGLFAKSKLLDPDGWGVALIDDEDGVFFYQSLLSISQYRIRYKNIVREQI